MDNLTKAQRKKNMQNIRSKNTTPERLIMRELQKRKVYFAHHVSSIIGKPDIVFRKNRVAVFIDSDFWHGHPARYIRPKTNRKYWLTKIRSNKLRDLEVNAALKKAGWRIHRVWECDIKNDTSQCVNRILKALATAKTSYSYARQER